MEKMAAADRQDFTKRFLFCFFFTLQLPLKLMKGYFWGNGLEAACTLVVLLDLDLWIMCVTRDWTMHSSGVASTSHSHVFSFILHTAVCFPTNGKEVERGGICACVCVCVFQGEKEGG